MWTGFSVLQPSCNGLRQSQHWRLVGRLVEYTLGRHVDKHREICFCPWRIGKWKSWLDLPRWRILKRLWLRSLCQPCFRLHGRRHEEYLLYHWIREQNTCLLQRSPKPLRSALCPRIWASMIGLSLFERQESLECFIPQINVQSHWDFSRRHCITRGAGWCCNRFPGRYSSNSVAYQRRISPSGPAVSIPRTNPPWRIRFSPNSYNSYKCISQPGWNVPKVCRFRCHLWHSCSAGNALLHRHWCTAITTWTGNIR